MAAEAGGRPLGETGARRGSWSLGGGFSGATWAEGAGNGRSCIRKQAGEVILLWCEGRARVGGESGDDALLELG